MANPEYNALKLFKKELNAYLKTLVSDIIELKKATNGRGSESLGIQPFKLSEAPPDSVRNELNDLSSHFDQAVGMWLKMLQMQKEFAEKRDVEQARKLEGKKK